MLCHICILDLDWPGILVDRDDLWTGMVAEEYGREDLRLIAGKNCNTKASGRLILLLPDAVLFIQVP